ncbi:hypothetical protein ACFL0S_10005 [Thermodesulfobacteriota bacterium]
MDSAPYHHWKGPDETIWATFHRADKVYLVRFPELADFEIASDGMSVDCHPVLGTSEETVQHLYTNQVLPLAMSMMGKLVFHGSAIEVDNHAVAFLAESGRGKSTLAASFAVNGSRFLTDDGLVLDPTSTGYQAHPGDPSIRLWMDSERELITPGTLAAPALPYTSKSRFLAEPSISFCGQPRPLSRVYFLGDGSSETIVFGSMIESEALVEFAKHSFLLDIEKRSLLSTHFDMLAKLVNQFVPYRLDFPRRFDFLERVRETIIEHLLNGE